MRTIDREGKFRGPVAEYALSKEASGAWCLVLKINVAEYLDGGTWTDWTAYGYCVYCRLYVIKKDATLNETACKQLKESLGWNGDIDAMYANTWQPPACQVLVKEDIYNGQTRYKGEWIDPYDYEGSGMQKAAESDVNQLKAQFGPSLRAWFGMQPAAAPAPAGKPTAPPPSKPKPAAPPPVAKSAVAPSPEVARDRAWAAFVAAGASFNRPIQGDALGKEWQRIYGLLFAEKDEATMTARDWEKMQQDGPSEMVPF
jgi:hypothetical protein